MQEYARVCKDLLKELQEFTERVCKNLLRVCKNLLRVCKSMQEFTESMQEFTESLQEFTEYARVCKNLLKEYARIY